MENENQYILQSVDNTLSIVELLCNYEELSLIEITSLTDYGKSSVYRMIATLEKHKLVAKTKDGKYRLGYRFASIGAVVTGRMELVEKAHGYLQELSAKTNETTHLAIMADDTKVQFIDKVRGDSSIWMESTIGMTREAHLTGTGKALLAFSDDKFIEKYIANISFKHMTEHSIKDAKALAGELEKVRKDGYACDLEESEEGLVCFAAPIFDFKGKAVAAISVSGFKGRMLSRREELVGLVKQTAGTISADI